MLVRRTANSLPGFEAISAEITVSYEMAEAADDLSRTFAMNREEQESGRNRGRTEVFAESVNALLENWERAENLGSTPISYFSMFRATVRDRSSAASAFS